ncbi:MAG: hypothetical protein LAT63_16970 [Marinobacter sp.]|nr:hypothetical protein [Marinobacter sp.]
MPVRLMLAPLMKWLGGGTVLALLAAGGLWLWQDRQAARDALRIEVLTCEAQALRVNRDLWQTTAAAYAEDLESLRRLQHETVLALQQLDTRLDGQRQHYDALRNQIQQATPEDDGPVAPVLRRVLEGLP